MIANPDYTQHVAYCTGVLLLAGIVMIFFASKDTGNAQEAGRGHRQDRRSQLNKGQSILYDIIMLSNKSWEVMVFVFQSNCFA